MLTKKTELVTALCEIGRRLDAARDPLEMRSLIRRRKSITAALQAMAPPLLRIFRGPETQ